MFRLSPLHLFHLILLVLSVQGQLNHATTVTTVDAEGDTVVLSISDYQGVPYITGVLTTFGGATTTAAPPRIVGAPNSNTGVPTIVFQYTSDAVVYTATFTPSYQSPSPTPTPSSGTIIAPADWTYTVPAAVGSGADITGIRALRAWMNTWAGIVAGMAFCVVLGAMAVV